MNSSYPANVDRYEVQEEIGRGSMSAVYRAYDPLFERDVALKFLLPTAHNAQRVQERFLQEARIIAALDHPGIVSVYDFGEYDNLPYLVMRLMPNGSLAERLRSPGIPLSETIRIIRHLAAALDEAHRQGIVHRDLKPSNILFDQRDMPFLSDFGIAKVIGNGNKLTNTGYLIGTPAYMSPEQIEGRDDLDGRSDIYSLGVLCYEMLTGELPFDTDTPFALAVKHIFDPVPEIALQRPDLPPICQTIIDTAMAKERENRYETAVSLANALQAVIEIMPSEMQVSDDTLRTLLVQDSPHNPNEKLAIVVLDSQEQPGLLARVTLETPFLPPTGEAAWPLQTGALEPKTAVLPTSTPARKRLSGRRRRLVSMFAAFAFLILFMLESGNVLSNNAVMAPAEQARFATVEMIEPVELAAPPTTKENQIEDPKNGLLLPAGPVFQRGGEVCGRRCQPDEEPKRRDSVMKLQVKEIVVKDTDDQTAH